MLLHTHNCYFLWYDLLSDPYLRYLYRLLHLPNGDLLSGFSTNMG